MHGYDKNWANIDLKNIPYIRVKPPGPKSSAIEKRAAKHMQGYSSQARLFQVAFESGKGVTLTDVDGNTYIDLIECKEKIPLLERPSCLCQNQAKNLPANNKI